VGGEVAGRTTALRCSCSLVQPGEACTTDECTSLSWLSVARVRPESAEWAPSPERETIKLTRLRPAHERATRERGMSREK
jgi:hypothetical protein